jgi:hypothetical protein
MMKGQLTQVCERWIDSCCLCFALDCAEQERSGFRYAYPATDHRFVFRMRATRERDMRS